ncbi:hypothetical protein NEA10_03710 [Phormidium yuhuli AB48]|uniref:Uncharacterized protein n=1 Tax=Phormidium yuhuli AB48 TaxID=2940671 RepID=A0ABY5ARJ5_9CYAN|nr:hypothetical protein [Phormidium yuhuli]USR91845.1 hypothetical protein NEA10_03710 [Phormidium yuhuli AB48]
MTPKTWIPLLTLVFGLIPQSVVAQSSPRLTPEDCRRLEVGMSEAELERILDELNIEPEQEPGSPGNSLWRWIDDDSGAVLLAVLRNQELAQLSCFGVRPSNSESENQHQLCAEVEMGMTLAEVRQRLGSPGEMVPTDNMLSEGLLWQWENPARQEVAILAFSNFDVLAGKTCLVSQTEQEQGLQIPNFVEQPNWVVEVPQP